MKMLDIALQFYARRGLAIFPCAQKKPLTENGFKAATIDEASIRRWWTEHPKAQIGLPCGARNHLLVVDSDGPQGNEWVKGQNWPHTLTVETSPGRFQLYFRQPEGIVTKPSAGQVAPQVDVRGDGSYIIGAFSFHHRTRKPYTIVRDISGAKETENPMLPWADAPASLLALVTANGAQPSPGCDSIPQGKRHATLLSLAGSFRASGFSPETVLANLRIANTQQCRPPLPDAEVQHLAQFVGTKPAGFTRRPGVASAEVVLKAVSTVETVPVEWLWQRRVPAGFLTLDVGDPGRGKSLANCSLAAAVSIGGVFPDGSKAPLGDVVFLSAEDSIAQTIRPRLEVAGADLSRVHFVESVKITLADGATGESFFSLARDLEKLGSALARLSSVKLVVIDPLVAFLGENVDPHKDAEVRRILGPLAALSEKMKFAVKGIMHLRKSDTVALLRVANSVGFVAAARVVWGFGRDPATGSLCMVPVKNNLASQGQPGIAYGIEDMDGIARMKWGEALSVSADDALSSELRNRSPRDEACEWLKDALANGPMAQKEIRSRAKSDGVAWRTVERAKAALGVMSRKASMGGGWVWELRQ